MFCLLQMFGIDLVLKAFKSSLQLMMLRSCFYSALVQCFYPLVCILYRIMNTFKIFSHGWVLSFICFLKIIDSFGQCFSHSTDHIIHIFNWQFRHIWYFSDTDFCWSTTCIVFCRSRSHEHRLGWDICPFWIRLRLNRGQPSNQAFLVILLNQWYDIVYLFQCNTFK